MVGLGSLQIRPASRVLPVAVLTASLVLGGCATTATPPPTPDLLLPRPPPPAELRPDTQASAEAELQAAERQAAEIQTLERKIAQLQLRLLEKEAQVAAVQEKLDGAIQEVIRAKAQLQSLESRAQAASTLAEAEVALSTVGAAAPRPEITQAEQLLEMSAAEFDNGNYGGSLYLTSQAKSLIAVAQGRVSNTDLPVLAGEVLFALPLPLRAARTSNVRDGPGGGFKVLFVLSQGVPLVGQAYKDEWVRIRDEQGRVGWIFHTLIESWPQGRP